MLTRFAPRDEAQTERARKVAAEILADRPNAGGYLCGSLFAGLGTPASDIDLYLITSEARATEQLEVAGIRVDIEFRSGEWLDRMVANCREFTVTPNDVGQLRHWPYERLDELVRFALGEIVADDGDQRLSAWKSRVDDSADVIEKLIVSQHGVTNANRAEDIWGALQVGDRTAAQSLARMSLTSTAEALLAARGDAYIGHKWVWTQWERTIGRTLGDDVRQLLHDPAVPVEVGQWLSQDFMVMACTGTAYPIVTAASPDLPRRDLWMVPFLAGGSVLLNGLDSRAVRVSSQGALLWGVAHGRRRSAAVAMAAELLRVAAEDVDRYYERLIEVGALGG